jgi:hypothetical protein
LLIAEADYLPVLREFDRTFRLGDQAIYASPDTYRDTPYWGRIVRICPKSVFIEVFPGAQQRKRLNLDKFCRLNWNAAARVPTRPER